MDQDFDQWCFTAAASAPITVGLRREYLQSRGSKAQGRQLWHILLRWEPTIELRLLLMLQACTCCVFKQGKNQYTMS